MPLLWISLSFLTGAVVPLFLSIPWMAAAISAVVLSIFAFLEVRQLGFSPPYLRLRTWIPVPLSLMAAAFLFGMLRGETGKPAFNPADLGWYNGKEEITLLAVVSQPVEHHDRSAMLTITAKEAFVLGSDPVPVSGEAMVLLPAGREYAYGDRLEIIGKLETPPEREDFSYKQYLENRGVYSYMAYPRIRLLEMDQGNPLLAAIFKVREAVARTSLQIVPQPQAAFLSGILVGRDETMPDAVEQAFKDTGTSHLVAISGFNITILSGLILMLTMRLLPRGWAVSTAILLLCAYTVMAGASPPVVRAAIMGGLAMIGRMIGRTKTAVNSLALASVIMVIFNPLILRDIGFQLSVLATAGILLIGAPVNDWFLSKTTRPQNPAEVNTWWRSVGELVLITLAAQVATLPVLLYHFQRFPVVGLLVNPLVLPVQPAAMTLGGIAVIAGLVFMPFGKILGLLAWLPLVYTTRMVELFAGLGRTGSLNVGIGIWQAVGFGLVLALAIIFWKQWSSRIRQFFFPAAFAILTASLALLLNTIMLYTDGKLHVEVFRQGSDLTTFVLSPGGQRILVTNRPGDKDLSAFIDQRLPILDRRLDAIIIPDPAASSSNGLGWTVSRYQPDWILINRQAGGFRVRSRLDEELGGVGFVGTDLVTGQQLDLGGGALLSVLSAGEKGSVVDIVWGSQKIVMMYGEHGEGSSIIRDEEVDVIVMDHPGETINFPSGRFVISANPGLQNAVNHFEVVDGSWLEIQSDGRITQILEPYR